MPIGGTPFLDAFEENPRLAFEGYIANQGFTPNRRKDARTQFTEFQNAYLGRLGQQISFGADPNTRVNDFLKDFNFERRAQERTPSERRRSTSRYSPGTRHLLNYY